MRPEVEVDQETITVGYSSQSNRHADSNRPGIAVTCTQYLIRGYNDADWYVKNAVLGTERVNCRVIN